MKRNSTIDFIRGFCMIYIVGVFHLSQYLGKSIYLNYNEQGNSFMWSCLGTFSLISGYLIGSKYHIESIHDVLIFYKKRIIRFYPLFVISSILLLVIGFNDIERTFYALSGLSPFVSHPPHTLWYISMIMFFYFLSPIILINRGKRIVLCLLSYSFILLFTFFITIDLRFLYNLFFYESGLYISSLSKLSKTKKLKMQRFLIFGGGILIVIYFVMFMLLDYYHFFLFRKIVDVIGVFVIVYFAKLIALLWPLENRIVYFLSYVSMSIYLFHRFTYWACLKFYNPDDIMSKLFYLLIIALPVGFVFAFYVQKKYDEVIKIIVKK